MNNTAKFGINFRFGGQFRMYALNLGNSFTAVWLPWLGLQYLDRHGCNRVLLTMTLWKYFTCVFMLLEDKRIEILRSSITVS